VYTSVYVNIEQGHIDIRHLLNPLILHKQKGPLRIMAKDLVRTRNYTTRFIVMKTHLNAVALKMQVKFLFKYYRIAVDEKCNERSDESFNSDE
jgi:hypothetical protein